VSSTLAHPPALSEPTPEPRPPGGIAGLVRDPRILGVLALLIACAVGLILALSAGVIGIAAVGGVLHTAVVALAFWGACGFALAHWLVRGELAAHRALLVLPIGVTASSLSLTLLGLLHVPLSVSLALLVALAVAADGWIVWTAWRRGSARGDPARVAEPVWLRVILPLLLAGMIALIALIPIFRAGYPTIPGQNGDAILVAGSATLLEHAPPTATRLDLPINHIPLQWRSKYPIYYALAGVSALGSQDPIRAFPTVSALILALTAIGFFLFARYLLRAPPWVALGILFLVPLDRIMVYVTIHPYYNELWGQFALPFTLLAGWRYLRGPTRASAALFAMFLLLGLLAYPLMLPFPLAFLAAYAWTVYRNRSAAGERPGWIAGLRLPRLHRRPWMWIPAAVLAVPVVLVLGRGFLEKTSEAASVIAPGTDLSGWHGKALPYLPWPRFFGMPEAGLGVIALFALLALGVLAFRRMPREVRLATAAMVGLAAFIAVYFRIRTGGELFYFKDLAFIGPFVLMLGLFALGALVASVGLRRPLAVAAAAGLALALVLVPASASHEINETFEQANLSIIGLRSWDQALPRGTSVRIDVPPSGYQLWVTYMFKDHSLSALDPLAGFFPHPPVGRKADYVIGQYDQPRPADAIGPPLFRNAQFTLWRMNPAVPGPDVSSRRLIDDISSVSFG
jgi:hypothetical protein